MTGLATPVASAHPEGFHVLVFSKTAAGAYRHDSIPAGITMFEELAADRQWELTKSEDSAVFNDATLATFDVVVMFQTSGMVWDTDAQRAAMQKYVRGGGGVVAIHNATDMNIEQQFPWWDRMLGMSMTAHSAIVPGTAKVADRVHPSGQGLPDRWNRTEEWYNFDRNARGDVHVLVTADETTYDAGGSRTGADHPVSWCRNFEGGRLWSTAMGHQASSYSEPLFRSHIAGGVESAGAKVAADCGPTVWSSFEKTELDGNTAGPAALDVAPDGRVFYAEYGGKVKAYKPDTRATVTAATLNVYTGGEDGLTGLALDPNFATTKWIYLMYSPSGRADRQGLPVHRQRRRARPGQREGRADRAVVAAGRTGAHGRLPRVRTWASSPRWTPSSARTARCTCWSGAAASAATTPTPGSTASTTAPVTAARS